MGTARIGEQPILRNGQKSRRSHEYNDPAARDFRTFLEQASGYR